MKYIENNNKNKDNQNTTIKKNINTLWDKDFHFKWHKRVDQDLKKLDKVLEKNMFSSDSLYPYSDTI